jgi:uncharacterized protein (UPF0548 family)
MFLFTRPTDAHIKEFLSTREEDSFSYPEVGASRETPPKGYNVDHNRMMIGSGLDDFEKAKTAVRQWKMFDVPG